MQKFADEWVPGWLGGAANRNPELFDAVMATALIAYVQWQAVQRSQMEERAAAARKEAEALAGVKQEGERTEPESLAAAA